MKVAFAWLRSKISHISRNSTERREGDKERGEREIRGNWNWQQANCKTFNAYQTRAHSSTFMFPLIVTLTSWERERDRERQTETVCIEGAVRGGQLALCCRCGKLVTRFASCNKKPIMATLELFLQPHAASFLARGKQFLPLPSPVSSSSSSLSISACNCFYL